MSDSKVKEGKKPLSSKVDIKEYLRVNQEDTGLLRIPAKPKAFAAKHGLKLAWRSYKEVASIGGYDSEGWAVFRRELLTKDPEFANSDTIEGTEFELGGHSSPVYQRGDIILCFMQEKEWTAARSREYEKAVRASKISKSASEIQQKVGSAVKIKQIDD